MCLSCTKSAKLIPYHGEGVKLHLIIPGSITTLDYPKGVDPIMKQSQNPHFTVQNPSPPYKIESSGNPLLWLPRNSTASLPTLIEKGSRSRFRHSPPNPQSLFTPFARLLRDNTTSENFPPGYRQKASRSSRPLKMNEPFYGLLRRRVLFTPGFHEICSSSRANSLS